jgi:putative tryptophan/tyrosine transport system substrate-binding protein
MTGGTFSEKSGAKSMKTKITVWLLATFVLAPFSLVHAQKQANIPRIGILRAGAPPDASLELFLQGLRALGYVEGKNIIMELRHAGGKQARASELAKELVQLEVDAIFTGGTRTILAVKDATQTIPIVMVSTSDPVGTGMVASLARPGGNITGMSLLASDLWPKRLELLKEIFPKLSTAAMLWNTGNAGMSLEANVTKELASSLGVTVQDRGVKDPSEIDKVFEAMSKDRPDAFLALIDLSLRSSEKRILEFLAENRLPAIFENKAMVEAGGLISYGPNYADVYRRAAIQMDKILKGTRPADIPVEQPTKFELVINLKTAKHIGLTIPPNVLARADRVIR